MGAFLVKRPQNAFHLAFGATLFLLPWLQGGELEWEFLFFANIILLIAFTLSIKYSPNELSKFIFLEVKFLRLGIYFLIAWLLYSITQLIPLPQEIIAYVSPNRVDICQKETEIGIICSEWIPLTISHATSILEVLKYFTYFLVFVLTFVIVQSSNQLIWLVKVIFFTCASVSLYAIINIYTENEFRLFDPNPPYVRPWDSSTRGTFSYQNHFAALLNIAIPLGITLLYSSFARKTVSGSNSRISHNLKFSVFVIRAIYILSLVMMLFCMVKTSSRGGLSVLIICSLLIFTLISLNKNYAKKIRLKFIAVAGLSGLLIVFLSVFGKTAATLYEEGYGFHGRTTMYETPISIMKDFPLVGTGPGTYPEIQSLYKSNVLSSSEISKRAFNDYLELVSNQGVIGLFLLGGAVLVLLLSFVMSIKTDNKHGVFPIQIGCGCAMLSVLLHSFIEFNFQLPVIAVYFYILLAIGIKSKDSSIGKYC